MIWPDIDNLREQISGADKTSYEQKNNRITVKDVARMAGVSTAAAGRALGGYGYVSEELREKIMRAAEELGYVASGGAGDDHRQSQTIGVVGADISNPFFAEALRGISDIARRHEFGVLTSSDEDVPREQEAVRILLEKQVDGLIVSPADINNCHHLTRLSPKVFRWCCSTVSCRRWPPTRCLSTTYMPAAKLRATC
jgi:hypothetical protein